jgi:hypothetical protein
MADVGRILGGNENLRPIPGLNRDLTSIVHHVEHRRGTNVELFVGARRRREN